jgi:hypothetical protein
MRDLAEELAEHFDSIQGAIERARWGAEPREVAAALRAHMRSVSRQLVAAPPPGFLDAALLMSQAVASYEHEPGTSAIRTMLDTFNEYRLTAEGLSR